MNLRVFVFAVLSSLIAVVASAQPMAVHTTNNIAIDKDAGYVTPVNNTDLGWVTVGQTKSAGSIYIRNTHTAAFNIVSITISGGNPSDFSVSYFPTTLNPGNSMSFQLSATPTTTSYRSAMVNINTNLPAPDNTFSFAVTCTGMDGTHSDLADIYFFGGGKDPKFKTNKKTGAVTAQIGETWSNAGPGNLAAGAVVYYYSPTPQLSFLNGTEITDQYLKAMAAPKPGKKPKKGKIKAKFAVPPLSGYIFILAGPQDGTLDPDWSNNVIRHRLEF